MSYRTIAQVGLVAVLLVGLVAPAAAVPATEDAVSSAATRSASGAMAAANNTTDANVTVTVGRQLSTVIGVSSDEVQTEFEDTAFELSVESADGEARARVIARRNDQLRERAQTLRAEFETATRAYEAGELTASEYAQRLASLSARAKNVRRSYDRLERRSENVSRLELRAAGVNRSASRAAVGDLRSISGVGPTALLRQFTGEDRGRVELDTDDGLSIEVRGEAGERSREVERARDDDDGITVSQSEALDTARAALSEPENGSWTLAESKVKRVDGVYEFEFVLRGDDARTGEAEVRIDGSSGDLFRLEEEYERLDETDRERVEDDEEREANETAVEREERADERAEDADDAELALVVSEGTPAPNETVTVAVSADGAPAANVTVTLNGRTVGATDAAGTVTVTLPNEDAKLTARRGEAEGELEFEFEREDEADEVGDLSADASVDGDVVTVTVRYEDSGVAGATLFANDRRVGETDADGTVRLTVDANATDELELELVKGEFETEFEFVLRDGSVVQRDGDEREAEDTDDERDEERNDDEREEDDDTERDDDGEEEDRDDDEGDDDEEDERESETEEERDEDDEDDR